MKDIRDLTTEAFGLIIAYLIPGLAGLFSLTFWSPTVKQVFNTFLGEKANINLFLLMMLAALGIGMLVLALRGFVFEKLLRRESRETDAPTEDPEGSLRRLLYDSLFIKTPPFSPAARATLRNPETRAAFVQINDAHYRFHQCWGGLAVVLPVLYAGWFKNSWTLMSYGELSRRAAALFESLPNVIGILSLTLEFTDFLGFFVPTFALLVAEAACVWAAKDAYVKYGKLRADILKGEDMANHWGVHVIRIEGGSVSLDFDESEFKPMGSTDQRRKFVNHDMRLLRVDVNGETVRELDPTDVIEIIYDD